MVNQLCFRVSENSESHAKQIFMSFSESKGNNKILRNHRPKKIKDAFEGKYVQCGSEKNKISSIKEYLEKSRSQLRGTIDDIKNLVSEKCI